MSKKITIAIDGYSSTGKSTVARQLARSLGYVYIDTGAMYRSVTLFAMRKSWINEDHFDEESLIKNLNLINIRFEFNKETGLNEVLLNDENVEAQIRKLAVSSFVSQVAAISSVRRKLVEQQQQMGENRGLVMDGRDIGTVVFPDAELKIFMTATAKDRAERRYKELKDRGSKATYEDVLKNVVERDHIDSTRKDSPLRKAEGAVEIDNSNLTLEDQFHQILTLTKQTINSL